MQGTKRNAKQVAEAVRNAGGVKAEACRLLGITRPTLDTYIKRWGDVATAYGEANEVNLDAAEVSLLAYVRGERTVGQGDERQIVPIDSRVHMDAVKFYLRTKGRARGYGDRLVLDFDPAKMTDEQLAAVAAGKDPDAR